MLLDHGNLASGLWLGLWLRIVRVLLVCPAPKNNATRHSLDIRARATCRGYAPNDFTMQPNRSLQIAIFALIYFLGYQAIWVSF